MLRIVSLRTNQIIEAKEVIKETSKAYCYKTLDGKELWIPKKGITSNSLPNLIYLKSWVKVTI